MTNFPIFRRSYNIRNFRSFSKNRSSSRRALSTLLLQVFTGLSNFPIFRSFYNIRNFRSFHKIAVLVGALSTPSSTGFHWLDDCANFLLILQYSQFSQKLQLLSGPSEPPFLLVSTDSTNFPISRKFCNFCSCVQTWTYLPFS